jgi:hypothetical protein
VGAQPAERKKEDINAFIWTSLTETVASRTALLRSLSEEASLEELPHSTFRPLLPLLSNMAAFLIVDRHWLDQTEVRNNEQYIPEAFQRLILEFILDNRSKGLMTQPVDRRFRQVQVISQNLSLQEAHGGTPETAVAATLDATAKAISSSCGVRRGKIKPF